MSTEEPLVSIVINNHNYGRFLRQAIESALNQTYRKTEVIVVDDGSTDDSREVIATYGQRIIPILKQNGGQASAINAGVISCQGEIVCFLDSDDIWQNRKVELVVKAVRQYPSAGVIYHRVQRASADLRSTGKPIPRAVFLGRIDDRVRGCGGWWACPPTTALCFKTSLLRRIGPIPENQFRICADTYLTYLAPLLSPVAGLRSCAALYRLHGANGFSSRFHWRTGGTIEDEKEHLRRYEEIITVVNQRLEELEISKKLDLKNHLSYQLLRYRLRDHDRLARHQLLYQGLRYSGNPSLTDRLKIMARLVIRTSGNH